MTKIEKPKKEVVTHLGELEKGQAFRLAEDDHFYSGKFYIKTNKTDVIGNHFCVNLETGLPKYFSRIVEVVVVDLNFNCTEEEKQAGTIEFKLKLDTGEAEEKIDRLQKKLELLGEAIDQADWSLEKEE